MLVESSFAMVKTSFKTHCSLLRHFLVRQFQVSVIHSFNASKLFSGRSDLPTNLSILVLIKLFATRDCKCISFLSNTCYKLKPGGPCYQKSILQCCYVASLNRYRKYFRQNLWAIRMSLEILCVAILMVLQIRFYSQLLRSGTIGRHGSATRITVSRCVAHSPTVGHFTA